MKNKFKPPNHVVAITFAMQFFLAITPTQAQLNETCTVTVNGQTVNVGAGGEFRIRNILAGPNLVRLYAICNENGKLRYARSGFFQLNNNQSRYLSELDLTWRDTPFPTVSRIIAVPMAPTLTAIGQTTQIRVTASFSDSTKKEVTARALGSTYASSNANIATVDENGSVTATGEGVVFIIASNEGATAVTGIIVSLGDPLTTVEGFIFDEDDAPIANAKVWIINLSSPVTTSADGRFSIPNVATETRPIMVVAKVTSNGHSTFGIAYDVEVIPGGITDAGIIRPDSATYFNDFEDQVGEGWSHSNTAVTPIGNRRFLGRFGAGTVSLTLTAFPRLDSAFVSFDLFIIQSWDGSNRSGGPDIWELRIGDGNLLLYTTFSNTGSAGHRQAYPDMYPGGDHPARTGADEDNTLGYTPYGDTVYSLRYNFTYSNPKLKISFSGLGTTSLGDIESWGLDNVVVVPVKPSSKILKK